MGAVTTMLGRCLLVQMPSIKTLEVGMWVQSLICKTCFLTHRCSINPLGIGIQAQSQTMSGMFNGRASAFNQGIGNWNVKLQSQTCLACSLAQSAFNQGIGKWSVGAVTRMLGHVCRRIRIQSRHRKLERQRSNNYVWHVR